MSALEQRVLAVLRSHRRQGLTKSELARKAGFKKKHKERFLAAAAALKSQNKLMERDGRFYSLEGDRLAEAKIVKVAATFGFARLEDTGSDVFVPGRMLLGALPEDKVLLRLSQGSGELEQGEVVRITQPSDAPFSGELRLEDGVCFILPDRCPGQPMAVARDGLGDARPGDKVLACAAFRGERHSEHRLRVLASFGSALSPAACATAVLADLDIPTVFPEEVKEEARRVAERGIHPKELESRTDLRGETVFTIDGAEAKDLDDAVSLRRRGEGWELGVHIADVSHYVAHGSPLDEEAFRRGTSVYYADSVVPMLPEELSNGICSLNPGEDRLAFSCFMELDADGRMTGFRFEKSVICSKVKGVYSELNGLLKGEGDAAAREKYAEAWETLLGMKELALLRMSLRRSGGGLELDSVESKIELDGAGEPIEVSPRERGFCERLIEEFMLLANEAAARYASERGLPFVYRIHEEPVLEKLEQLYEVLGRLGLEFRRPRKDALASGLADILRAAGETRYFGTASALMLRSMAKARYSGQNSGHFGLSLKNYAHFTSPIRRYPDLAAHRILTAALSPVRPENLQRRFEPFAVRAAERSTLRELAAQSAERGCEACYKAAYMGRFIGREFQGTVSGCAAHGAYIQLANTCEGLARPADFPPGDWAFDGLAAFTGAGKIQLGDAVRVRVLSVNISAGQIDFALLGADRGQ